VKALLATIAIAAALAGSHRVGQAGVTIALPRGWHSIPLVRPPSTEKNDPVTRIVASSGPIVFGRGCGQLDYRFPANGVAIVVVEWVRRTFGPLPPRPRRFTAKTLPVRAPPALECFDGPGGGVEFSDHGRRFAVYILLGRRASPALADRARAVLITLRVAAARR
jgi:hypothetical protein